MMSHGSNPVTYEEVVEAFDTLLEEGKTKDEISGRLIRSKVGDRGSLKTLIKHRDQYRRELDEKAPKPEQYVTDDDLAPVRAAMNEVATRQIEMDRAKSKVELEEAGAQIKALEAKITDLEDIAAETEQRLEEALDQEATTRESLEDLQGRLTGTEAALEEARRTTETLALLLSRMVAEPAAQSAEGDNSDGQTEEHKAAVDVAAVNARSDDTGNRFDDDHNAFPLDTAAFTFPDDE